MTYAEETAMLVASINRAERARDAWRGAGDRERYMEAYSLVRSLQLQLDRHLTTQYALDSEQAAPLQH